MRNKYTDQFYEWLSLNYKGTSDKLIRKIKKKFGYEMTRSKLYAAKKYARKLGYNVGELDYNKLFRKGMPTWNMLHARKVGSIKKRNEGYYIKLEDGKWHPHDRYIYEQVNGKIPKEMFLIHINGNIWDDRIENLQIVNRHVLNFIIAQKLYFDNRKEFEIACLVGELAHKKPHYIRPSRRKVVEQNVSN